MRSIQIQAARLIIMPESQWALIERDVQAPAASALVIYPDGISEEALLELTRIAVDSISE